MLRRISEFLEDGENRLSGSFRHLLPQGHQQPHELNMPIKFYAHELRAHRLPE